MDFDTQKKLSHYLDLAKENQGLTTERELARALGHASNYSVQMMRKGVSFPSDETMLKLAKMAGENPKTALARLNEWRTKSPEAREHYAEIAERLAKQASTWLICTVTVAMMTIAQGTNYAYAAENNARTGEHLHYVAYKLCNK